MPGKVLKNVVVAVAGTLSCSHSAFEDFVTQNGGEFSSGVSQRVTHLVATKEEMQTKSAKVKKAVFQEIPIVSETFLRDSVAKGKLLEEEKYTLRSDDYVDDDDFIEEDDDIFDDDAEPEDDSQSENDEPDSQGKKRKRTGSGTVKAKKPRTKKEPSPKRPMMSEADFFVKAQPLSLEFDANEKKKGKKSGEDTLVLSAAPKRFTSGSLGWGVAGKTLKVTVAGKELTAQISANLVIRGSKPKKEPTEKKEETKEPTQPMEEEPQPEMEQSGDEAAEPEEQADDTDNSLTDSRELPTNDMNLPDVLENLDQIKDNPVYQDPPPQQSWCIVV